MTPHNSIQARPDTATSSASWRSVSRVTVVASFLAAWVLTLPIAAALAAAAFAALV